MLRVSKCKLGKIVMSSQLVKESLKNLTQDKTNFIFSTNKNKRKLLELLRKKLAKN